MFFKFNLICLNNKLVRNVIVLFLLFLFILAVVAFGTNLIFISALLKYIKFVKSYNNNNNINLTFWNMKNKIVPWLFIIILFIYRNSVIIIHSYSNFL